MVSRTATCLGCGKALPKAPPGRQTGRPRVYCSDACRKRADRAESHRNGSTPEAAPGPNRLAAEETVTALRESGQIEAADATRAANLLTTASAVDADPGNGALRRELRLAEAVLRHDDATIQADAYASSMALLIETTQGEMVTACAICMACCDHGYGQS
jgi:hypothetical protein